jgi:hypothetical protein
MSEINAKPEDIVSKLESSEKTGGSNLEWFEELKQESDKVENLEKDENAGILKMRKLWSTCVLALIVSIVLFDMILVCLVGLGVWNFNNPSIVITVITENFLKIVGLGVLITREIFRKIYH